MRRNIALKDLKQLRDAGINAEIYPDASQDPEADEMPTTRHPVVVIAR